MANSLDEGAAQAFNDEVLKEKEIISSTYFAGFKVADIIREAKHDVSC